MSDVMAPIKQVSHYSANGSHIGSSNWTERFKNTYGCLPAGMMREDIENILESNLPQGVVMRGKWVTAIADLDNKKVGIELQNGDTEEVDLLIGADGRNSLIRQFVLNSDSASDTISVNDLVHHHRTSLPFSGIELWTGIADENVVRAINNSVFEPATTIVSLGNNTMCTAFPAGSPHERKRSWYLLRNVGRDADCLDGFREDSPSHLLSELGGETTTPNFVKEMISASSRLQYVRLPDQQQIPTNWWRGRIVLTGDACHALAPHLQQGASMALEASLLLGRLIGRALPSLDSTSDHISTTEKKNNQQNINLDLKNLNKFKLENTNVDLHASSIQKTSNIDPIMEACHHYEDLHYPRLKALSAIGDSALVANCTSGFLQKMKETAFEGLHLPVQKNLKTPATQITTIADVRTDPANISNSLNGAATNISGGNATTTSNPTYYIIEYEDIFVAPSAAMRSWD